MKKAKKNKFANTIIAICVGVCFVITITTLWEYHRLDIVLPVGVLTALLGFWGGELLIIALRQIFGSDIVKQAKKTDINDNEMFP